MLRSPSVGLRFSYEDLSYEEWIIEERLRMKTGKARRAMLTEDSISQTVFAPLFQTKPFNR